MVGETIFNSIREKNYEWIYDMYMDTNYPDILDFRILNYLPLKICILNNKMDTFYDSV